MYYKNEPVDNYDYEDQPHEIAAREEKLYTKNLMQKEKILINFTQNQRLQKNL